MTVFAKYGFFILTLHPLIGFKSMCSPDDDLTYSAPHSDIVLFEVESSFMSGTETGPISFSSSFSFEDSGVVDGGSIDYYEE